MNAIREKPYYKPLLWILAALIFTIIFWLGMDLVSNPEWFMGDDFVQYWAAGKLNLAGANPYAPEQLLPLEIQTGVMEGPAVIMWNPPWILAITMPFGIAGYPFSRILWLVVNILVIFVCLNKVWELYGGEKKYRWVAWLIGFTFAPLLGGLKKGQTSALLFVGVVGFLFFIQRRKYWWAGVFISALAIMPHVLYLYAMAVFFWSIAQKKWRVILGALASLVVASFFAWILNPSVFQQYLFAIQYHPPTDWATPTIGGLLRLFLGIEKFWLQFVAPLIGFIWFIFYWIRNHKNWNWIEQSPLLILVSTLTAAYGWSWDQTVSVIAILQIASLLLPIQKSRSTILIVSSYLIIDMLALLLRGNQLLTFWYAPTLLIYYLAARAAINTQADFSLEADTAQKY